MFKDDYKKANQAVHLTDSHKQEMLESLDSPKRRIKDKRKASPVAIMAVALAACLILTVGLSLAGAFGSRLNIGLKLKSSKFAHSTRSYSDVYELVADFKTNEDYWKYSNSLKGDDMIWDGMPVPEGATSSVNGDHDYSTTNTQVKGVDEADKVKTNGECIFALSPDNRSIVIYKADGKATEKIAHIDGNKEDGTYFTGMYLYENMLIAISTSFDICPCEEYGFKTSSSYRASATEIFFYDISKPTSPKLINSLKQDGSCNDKASRIANGVLYTITIDNSYNTNLLDKAKPETYIPGVFDGKERLIDPNSIYAADEVKSLNYTVVTAVDLKNTAKFKSELALLGSITDMYASNNSILIYNTEYESSTVSVEITEDGKSYEVLPEDEPIGYKKDENRRITHLYLIDIREGELRYATNTKLNGYINDQFSIDEYKDHFRIVLTDEHNVTVYKLSGDGGYAVSEYYPDFDNSFKSSTTNSLYVLDYGLKTTGKIENIAKDEHIKSARFFGDIGYFVTFRQTDPLFSVDLSDVTNPKIIGELKIPGFSEYLQSYGKGLLFGFGSAADIESGGVTGLKLSMFDISDPADVTELACKELEGMYSSASYNHKAILVDSKKNIIGFPVDSGYLIYSYKDGEFVKSGAIEFTSDLYWSYDMRGLYIDSYYYVVDTNMDRLVVLSMENFKHIKTVKAD